MKHPTDKFGNPLDIPEDSICARCEDRNCSGLGAYVVGNPKAFGCVEEEEDE